MFHILILHLDYRFLTIMNKVEIFNDNHKFLKTIYRLAEKNQIFFELAKEASGKRKTLAKRT